MLQRARMFIEWLRNGLAQPHKTQRGLAEALGVAPSAVSRLLSGEREFLANEIAKAAIYLNVPPPLVGRQPIERVQTIPVRYVVARGLWRERGVVPFTNLSNIPIVCDSRYAGMEQWAARMDASQAYVVCVAYEQARAMPRPGDVVLVERTRDDLCEFFLCTVLLTADGEWHLTTSDAPYVDYLMNANDVRIIGLCIGRYQSF